MSDQTWTHTQQECVFYSTSVLVAGYGAQAGGNGGQGTKGNGNIYINLLIGC